MQPRFSDRACRDLRKLDPQTRDRIVEGIERYAATGTGDVKRVKAQQDVLRLRIGNWRVFFTQSDQEIVEINAILHRRDAYR